MILKDNKETEDSQWQNVFNNSTSTPFIKLSQTYCYIVRLFFSKYVVYDSCPQKTNAP